ncbi:hypothetical protein AB0K14_20600 [Actinosynnema sp. NPDC050801]|uniref:hypothetical protein n=1 Tax=unclassified Actinosynnema TaxID=2637065 RepID=UPI0033DF5BED
MTNMVRVAALAASACAAVALSLLTASPAQATYAERMDHLAGRKYALNDGAGAGCQVGALSADTCDKFLADNGITDSTHRTEACALAKKKSGGR